MPERSRQVDEDAADVRQQVNVLLETPAIAPPCFAHPEPCDACKGCGLRLLCYERHAEEAAVHLLPRSRFPA